MITQCPYCARPYNAPPDEMGKVIQCACGKAFVAQASDGMILLTPAMRALRPNAPSGWQPFGFAQGREPFDLTQGREPVERPVERRPARPLTAAHSRSQRAVSKPVIAKTGRPSPFGFAQGREPVERLPAKNSPLRNVLFFLSCLAGATIIVGVTWKVTNSDAVGAGGPEKTGPVAINKPKPSVASRPVAPPMPEANPATVSGAADPTSAFAKASADPPAPDPEEVDRQRQAAQQVFEQVRELVASEQNDKAVNMLANMLNDYPRDVWPEGALKEYQRLAQIVTKPASRPVFFGVESRK